MRRLALFVGLLAAFPHDIGAQQAWARVAYVSGTSVYLDAGTNHGVREGTRFTVVRSGVPVAELVAEFVSSTRTSCRIEASSDAPVIGDSVRFSPDTSQSALRGQRPGEAAALRQPGTAAAATRRGSLRGRVGVRYLVVAPLDRNDGGLAQPAFDVRLDGEQLGGTSLAILVDVRAQRSNFGTRSTATPAPTAENSTRVYQGAVAWNARTARVTVGRQFASAISTLGLFDGVAVDLNRRRFSAGLLSGLQPEPLGLGLSGNVREYAAYVQAHNVPASGHPWSVTLGGAGTYDRGQINREFLYLRANYTGQRLSLFAAQELDVNRGWRGTVEGSTTTPTSAFVLAQLFPTDWMTVTAGLDSRRNVRLYRDFVSPETAFDDAFREGHWGGVTVQAFGKVRFGADLRQSGGEGEPETASWTGSASIARLAPLGAGLRARFTRFTGGVSTGELRSASLELNPAPGVRVEFTSGARESTNPADSLSRNSLTWTSFDIDLGVGKSVYLFLSTSRETGTFDKSVRSYAALSYRF